MVFAGVCRWRTVTFDEIFVHTWKRDYFLGLLHVDTPIIVDTGEGIQEFGGDMLLTIFWYLFELHLPQYIFISTTINEIRHSGKRKSLVLIHL